MPPPDIERESLDAQQRIALALECINRHLYKHNALLDRFAWLLEKAAGEPEEGVRPEAVDQEVSNK